MEESTRLSPLEAASVKLEEARLLVNLRRPLFSSSTICRKKYQ
jgi:hypothetical protein